MENSADPALSDPLNELENSDDVVDEPEITEVPDTTNISELDEVNEEGSISSSVQIAPTAANSSLGDEDDPMLFIELGDRVVFDSTTYGRTIGTIYYRSLDRIRIKPDGVSNTLHTFELEQTDDEELYKENDDGTPIVKAAYVIEKRKFESFVEQQDFRINQLIDTFDVDGKLYKSYKIVKVDKENDYIILQDKDETDPDQTQELNFNFIGIEPDEDFIIISIRQFVGEEDAGPSNGEAPSEEIKEEDVEPEEDNGIEVVGFIEVTRPKILKEAASYEQRIPDGLQKIDALNDFLSGLDPSLQKDPKAVRSIRILVETLFHLKQATVQYNDDGSIRGPKAMSVTTLSELIERASVPLGRAILSITKKVYRTEEDMEEKIEADEVHFEDFEKELEQMKNQASKLVAGEAKGSTIIREWNDQQTFLKQFLSTWSPNGMAPPIWKALVDSEFFRQDVPSESDSVLPGYIPSHDKDTPPIFDKVPFGIERALATTYRKGADRKKQVLLAAEGASMMSYLMFPIQATPYLGSTRSHQLAIDSGRSLLPPKTMKMILKELGEPKEMGATSNDIVLLNVSGNTLGNIPLADYIEGISVPALGLGDALEIIEQYGMEQLEPYPELLTILQKKIDLYQAQLITTLAKLRQMISTDVAKEPEQNPFLDHPAILEDIRGQPILAEALVEYERVNPSLAQSDIGKVLYLLHHHANYFQIAAGKNSVLMARALLQTNNMEYLKQLQIANTIKYNTIHAGDKPKKNTCKHVADLVSIRKLHDDSERFHELATFFKIYQGHRDDNWIDCNVCKEHLLCIHERLQLQVFLNQKEKDIIEKEIILKCAGGQFQGKYICRNCGQSIRDLDFDNNIEFDDNGKPKSGRAVLVDDDALLDDKIDEMVSVPIEQSQVKQLNLNDDEIKCYNIIREIAERVGIQLDNEGYRNIISRVITWINKFYTSDAYAALKRSRPTLPDYDVAVARNIITASAIFLLLEIQCKIPSYVVRYALMGCKSPGFEGYPLEDDSTKMQGIEYIACAVSSIRRNEAPWNQSGFQKIPEDLKRQKGIMQYMLNILKEVISDDIIQSRLSEKRKYSSEVLGTAVASYGISQKDMIYPSFLPEQIFITPELAAKDVIKPEVAENMGYKGRLALVKLWIRQAHIYAKKTASLVKGSPMSETTCCSNNIDAPGAFWIKAADLPPMSKRLLQPNQQGQPMMTEFVPREAGSDVVTPNKDQYYRIFLKYCFQGDRIGHAHEPGLTHQCKWCGFQFPTHPSVMDTDTEGKTALNSQEVKTDTEEFTTLLDTIHNVHSVPTISYSVISSVTDIMKEFGSIQPPPIPGWQEVILETTTQFLKLPPSAERDDIALAVGAMSDATTPFEKIIMERLTVEKYQMILESISKLSWINMFQVIQTYFMTPFQRIVSQFSRSSLFIPIELVKSLSKSHAEQDLEPILQNDMTLLLLKEEDMKRPSLQFARSKLTYFLKQMSALLPFKNKIRPLVVPGKDITLGYIQRAILYGPLAILINPSEIPEGTEITSPIKAVGDPSMRFLLEIVAFSLEKYYKERLSFNDKEIKELIAIRDEKERVNVVAEFNKLSDEERAVELMNKRLGLGKWAVGGTKLIYAYDKDYYDLERQKRLNAGIVDFPGLGDSDVAQGRNMDAMGFPMHSAEEYEREGGYDNNQHGDDDYE